MQTVEEEKLLIVSSTTGQIYKDMDIQFKNNKKEKFYLTFIELLDTIYNKDKKLPAHVKVLQVMLFEMNYNNHVSVGGGFRELVKQKYNISERTTKDAVYYLEKIGYISKRAMNEYTVNSNLFGKGSIKEIKKLRLKYDMDCISQNDDNEKYSLTIEKETWD